MGWDFKRKEILRIYFQWDICSALFLSIVLSASCLVFYISVGPEALIRNKVLLCTKHWASILKNMVCFGKIVKS